MHIDKNMLLIIITPYTPFIRILPGNPGVPECYEF